MRAPETLRGDIVVENVHARTRFKRAHECVASVSLCVRVFTRKTFDRVGKFFRYFSISLLIFCAFFSKNKARFECREKYELFTAALIVVNSRENGKRA